MAFKRSTVRLRSAPPPRPPRATSSCRPTCVVRRVRRRATSRHRRSPVFAGVSFIQPELGPRRALRSHARGTSARRRGSADMRTRGSCWCMTPRARTWPARSRGRSRRGSDLRPEVLLRRRVDLAVEADVREHRLPALRRRVLDHEVSRRRIGATQAPCPCAPASPSRAVANRSAVASRTRRSASVNSRSEALAST